MDPPRAEIEAGIAIFEAKEYHEAQVVFDRLRVRYPESATALVWRAEATLYEFKQTEPERYLATARAALVHYRAAEALHDAGCRLPEREHYYLRLGAAYAHLRLNDLPPAIQELGLARTHWPDSAEVTYTLARAHCAAGAVSECVADFEATLEIARSLRRPLFLRTHRSVEDWMQRAATQSELGPLRAHPRYQELLREARH